MPAWRAGPAPRFGSSSTFSRGSLAARSRNHSAEPSLDPSTAITSSWRPCSRRSGSTKAGRPCRRLYVGATTETRGSSGIWAMLAPDRGSAAQHHRRQPERDQQPAGQLGALLGGHLELVDRARPVEPHVDEQELAISSAIASTRSASPPCTRR